MTTAHRPTWHSAIGSGVQIQTRVVSAKDQVAHSQLKTRQIGQSSVGEVSGRDFRSTLEVREKEEDIKKSNGLQLVQAEEKKVDVTRLLADKPAIDEEVFNKYDDADAEDTEEDDDISSSSSDNDSNEDDDSDDDEEELQRELERIKAERLQAAKEKEAAEQEANAQAQLEGALEGNPLMSMGGSSSSESAALKRQWNDDVVFRHTTRGEPEQKKRFINDVVRNDFHRMFLKKYFR
jgi:protein CWC15